MDPQPYDQSSRHSVELDRKFWAANPDFFFNSLPPRLSKYAVRADDACIQAQIDVFGKDHVGILPGSLAPSGNFAAVIYAESLPDRLPIVAYLNELLSFYEGMAFLILFRLARRLGRSLTGYSFRGGDSRNGGYFDMQLHCQSGLPVTVHAQMGSTLDEPVPKDPKFNNATWQANFKLVLPKLVKTLCEADPVLGGKIMKTFKEIAETPDLGPRMNTYENMDDYINDRIPDIAWA